jgi:hypothetical protein
VVQTLVDSGAIDQTMQNSLMSKIDAATASSTAENICAAVNQLDALANQVEAQTGKKISAEASALLLSYIANVQAGLQSGSGVTCE